MKHTTFVIKDEKKYVNIKHVAGLKGMDVMDYLWEAVVTQANKESSGNLMNFMSQKPKPPSDPFNIKGWKSFVETLNDKKEWKKFDSLASDLVTISNKKRAELVKNGKLR